MAEANDADASTDVEDLYRAAGSMDDIRHMVENEMDLYQYEEGATCEIVYDSVYSDSQVTFTGTVVTAAKHTLTVDNGEDEQRIVKFDDRVLATTDQGERKVGTIESIKLARSERALEATEAAKEAQEDDEEEQELPEDTEDYTREDWDEANDLDEDEHWYVSTTGSITRHCPACGYEGTHDHPQRSRPTYHADKRHRCPHADCGRTLHSGPAAECEDCEAEQEADDSEYADAAMCSALESGAGETVRTGHLVTVADGDFQYTVLDVDEDEGSVLLEDGREVPATHVADVIDPEAEQEADEEEAEAEEEQESEQPEQEAQEAEQEQEEEDEGQASQGSDEPLTVRDVLLRDPSEHYNESSLTYTEKQTAAITAALANLDATEDEVAEEADCTGRYVYDCCARFDADDTEAHPEGIDASALEGDN